MATIKTRTASPAPLNARITVGSVDILGVEDAYTKDEVDELLTGKSDVDHDHIVESGLLKLNTQEAFDFLQQKKISEMQANQIVYKYAAPIEHTHEDLALKTHTHSYNSLYDKPEIPSIEGLAPVSYVDNAISGLIKTAPESLDTLYELSRALGDDPNFATTVTNELAKKADQSYVENQLLNKSDVDHDHIVKAGMAEYGTQEAFDMLRNEIGKKANTTYVDNAINTALGTIESQLDEIIGDEEV